MLGNRNTQWEEGTQESGAQSKCLVTVRKVKMRGWRDGSDVSRIVYSCILLITLYRWQVMKMKMFSFIKEVNRRDGVLRSCDCRT